MAQSLLGASGRFPAYSPAMGQEERGRGECPGEKPVQLIIFTVFMVPKPLCHTGLYPPGSLEEAVLITEVGRGDGGGTQAHLELDHVLAASLQQDAVVLIVSATVMITKIAWIFFQRVMVVLLPLGAGVDEVSKVLMLWRLLDAVGGQSLQADLARRVGGSIPVDHHTDANGEILPVPLQPRGKAGKRGILCMRS